MTARTMSTAEAVDHINARTATTGTRRRIGADTLRTWAADGRVPAARNGANWIFTDAALDAWMADGMAPWSERAA